MKARLMFILICFVSNAEILFAETDVSFSGNAAVTFGYKNSEINGKSSAAYGFPVQDDQSGVIISSHIKSGNLLATIILNTDLDTVMADSAELIYNFGLASIAFDAVSIHGGWNDESLFADYADGMSFTVTALELVYFSYIGLADEINRELDNYNDKRLIPVISMGLKTEIGFTSVTTGLVYDNNDATDFEKTGEEPLQKKDYQGYLGFLNCDIKVSSLTVSVGSLYGYNCGALVDETNLYEGSSLFSLIISTAYIYNQTYIPGFECAYALKRVEYEGDFSAVRINPSFGYKIDENLIFTAGFSYIRESAIADDRGVKPDIEKLSYFTTEFRF